MPGTRKLGRGWKLLASVGLGLVLAEGAARIFLPAPQVVTIHAAERAEQRRALETAQAMELRLAERPDQGGGLYVETAECFPFVRRL